MTAKESKDNSTVNPKESKRKFDVMGHPYCIYCGHLFLDEDDLAECESSHGSKLDDFELVNDRFRLKK